MIAANSRAPPSPGPWGAPGAAHSARALCCMLLPERSAPLRALCPCSVPGTSHLPFTHHHIETRA
eukprot:6247431-Alexandrium_andersonii.AAC.1